MLNVHNAIHDDITEQDYLDGEKNSTVKHEYIDGKIYAMAGSSKRHNRIILNTAMALRSGAKASACDVYVSDIKVKINSKRYYYPDVVVGCDETDDADPYYLEKPCLIVEVLSPSTVRKDGTEKLLAYQNLASLHTYIMIEQDKCMISLIYQQDSGHWTIDYYNDMNDVILLTCPAMEWCVKDVYDGVQFNQDG
jgi:Uma2 family endonuclease